MSWRFERGRWTAATGAALVICVLSFAVWHAGAEETEAVHAVFSLETPAKGPFPSDWFTVAEPANLTGRTINLPVPDCGQRPSDCEDLGILNSLDGFNLQPRVSIPFDGPIDPATVTFHTILLISLGSTLGGHCRYGAITGVNQVVWDANTLTLHAESDELLDQHTRYALIVTRRIRDNAGRPIEASPEFCNVRDSLQGEYGHALRQALRIAGDAGVPEEQIAAASIFTTQSATAVLEKIRDQLDARPASPANFNLGPGGLRTVFRLADIQSIAWNQHLRHDPDQISSVALDLSPLRLIPGAIDAIAYGVYTSPEYLVHPGEFIPPIATLTGMPKVESNSNIYFNLVLPAGAKPPNGWPVAIYGTGAQGTKDTWTQFVAASMAARGIATIAINFYGNGFGPRSTLTVNTSSALATFPSGGRGTDQNGDGLYGSLEGFEATPALLSTRDSFRQTVVDWMQLVRTIQAGVDIDGDGIPDLDSSRIYYFGNSTGGQMGLILTALEPAIRAAVFNHAGGTIVDYELLSGLAGRIREGQALGRRMPSLVNTPGVSAIEGVPLAGPPFFFDNRPLRDEAPLRLGLEDGTTVVVQSPQVNTARGAMEIQEWTERKEWAMNSGDPLCYARHLRANPLSGVTGKAVLFQIAKGDRNMPNPTSTALLRAGDVADRAVLYRHDLAIADNPALDKNPHQFLIRVDIAATRPIAMAYQSQIAAFFASDGTLIEQPEPRWFFEVPIHWPLPEGINFLP